MKKFSEQTLRNILDEVLGPELPFKPKTPEELRIMFDQRIRELNCTICRGIYDDGTCQACGRILDGPSNIHD